MPNQAVAVATVIGPPTRSVERWFYIGMGIAATVVVALGFGPSIVNTSARNAPLNALAATHGAVYAIWLLVYVAQAALVATHRTSIHRRLGAVAVVLVPIMIVLGCATAIAMGRRGVDLSGDLHIQSDPYLGMVNPLGDLAAFVVLVSGKSAR